MKSSTLIAISLACALFSLGAFASTFSPYSGKKYSSDNVDQCRADYATIAASLESKEGFRILDGGCLPYGMENYKIQFSYAHPVTKRIEYFNKTVASADKCSALAAEAKENFEEVGNHFIASYCQGSRLQVDFIDYTASVMRELSAPVVFTEPARCEVFLNGLKTKLASHDMSLIFEECSEKKTFDGETYFTVEGEISAKYDKSLKFLEGKSAQNVCLSDYSELEEKFENNGMKLVHGFCESKNLKGEAREVLAVINFFNGTEVKTYNGMSYASENECAYQLDKAAQGLEELGNPVLYKYCQGSNFERQRPVIYYSYKFKLKKFKLEEGK